MACKTEDDMIHLMRGLALTDLFFLCTEILARKDMDRDWVFDRCMEVQTNPNGYLDLWARKHFKSSIITTALTLQNILNYPEWTFGIFSFTRPIAKAFLRQIKLEAENNIRLKQLFPDRLWQDPRKEAPKWSEDDGLIFKRASNPKESTLEAWGLVDGQPTTKHFKVKIYDDIVTKESVTTPEMIQKTTDAWAMSKNLGTLMDPIDRYAGTFYHYNDTYTQMIKRGSVKTRIYPATDDGTRFGKPVLMDAEDLGQFYKDMGVYIFSCQMLLDPKKESTQGFQEKWLRYWQPTHYQNMNRYILVDPASKKKKDNDYSVFMVVGLGADRNYYLIDMIRDRLNLRERGNVLFALHRDYRPLAVGYEEYGMQCDREYMEERMGRDNYRFHITPLGGNMKKEDRINMLIPSFHDGRWWIPNRLMRTNSMKQTEDLINIYVNDEYLAFPFGAHDDMMDCQARILDDDLEAYFPEDRPSESTLLSPREKAMIDALKEEENARENDYNPLRDGL